MSWRLLIIFTILLLYGCAQHVQPPASVAGEGAPPPKPAMQVVVLVSEDIPAYSDVAKALVRQLGRRGSVRYMTSSQINNQKMIAAFSNDEHKQIVSIGLSASVAAKGLTNRQVIFCQVFNYQDYALLSARHKGVSMMPSLSKTFSSWKTLSPDISDVGVISGPGFDDLIQAAKVAAKSYGITLHHATVNSDKEYQYAYKQMARKVQGYWLLPDNRVLSGFVLRDVMTFSVRNSKQVNVFNNELLKLGGLLSTGSDAQDIALEVIDRLEQGQDKDEIPGPEIVYPNKLNLRINSVMAQRFNINVPGPFRKYVDAP